MLVRLGVTVTTVTLAMLRETIAALDDVAGVVTLTRDELGLLTLPPPLLLPPTILPTPHGIAAPSGCVGFGAGDYSANIELSSVYMA